MKIKIMKETSTFSCNLSIGAQDVGLYCYTNSGFANNGPNHQSIKQQASLPKDHNTVTNDNHQNMTPPPFDKEKLLAM
jgi:hypothetical protein